jgi:exopolyphosphatase/guanosine-5'-triphosphate,3'-diphosphate pyrophosphatase
MTLVDVGSNTVRLVIADVDGAVPLPVHTAKRRLRLSEDVEPDGRIPEERVADLGEALVAACREAERWGSWETFAFATAIVRDAPNREEVLSAVAERSGLALHVFSGESEAELTFLAARRWMGWQAGPMAMLDIGGGSLEVAFGRGGLPDFAASLPLGAGRLTREHFGTVDDPPSRVKIKEVRRAVRHRLRDVAARLQWESPRTAVATSRTFQQLARLCGAAPGRLGPFTPRLLQRSDLGEAVNQLRRLTAAQRARLPGISKPRSRQSLAGALVAHTTMKMMNIETVHICPWGLREGVLLRRIEEGGMLPVARAGDTGAAFGAGMPSLEIVARS